MDNLLPTLMMASSTVSNSPAHPLASDATKLSRQHRAWIALYALYSGQWSLADALRLNDVTEADLVEFEASWARLRYMRTTVAA